MNIRRSTIALFLLTSLVLPMGAQQTPDDLQSIRKDIESIKKSQEAIQKDLAEIKTLLRSRPAGQGKPNPADIKVSLDGEPIRGEKTARLVMVEFSDYQ